MTTIFPYLNNFPLNKRCLSLNPLRWKYLLSFIDFSCIQCRQLSLKRYKHAPLNREVWKQEKNSFLNNKSKTDPFWTYLYFPHCGFWKVINLTVHKAKATCFLHSMFFRPKYCCILIFSYAISRVERLIFSLWWCPCVIYGCLLTWTVYIDSWGTPPSHYRNWCYADLLHFWTLFISL